MNETPGVKHIGQIQVSHMALKAVEVVEITFFLTFLWDIC